MVRKSIKFTIFFYSWLKPLVPDCLTLNLDLETCIRDANLISMFNGLRTTTLRVLVYAVFIYPCSHNKASVQYIKGNQFCQAGYLVHCRISEFSVNVLSIFYSSNHSTRGTKAWNVRQTLMSYDYSVLLNGIISQILDQEFQGDWGGSQCMNILWSV